MKSYEVTETIDAGPDEVWAVLGDVEHYPDWDSGVERVEGRLEPGGKLKASPSSTPGAAIPSRSPNSAPGRA